MLPCDAPRPRRGALLNPGSIAPLVGRRIVTASEDKTARVWDATTGKALSEPMKHDDAVRSAQFSPDGKTALSASADTEVILLPVRSLWRQTPETVEDLFWIKMAK